jgi:hypothetical protein
MFCSDRQPMALCMHLAIYIPSTHPFEVVGLCGSAEECEAHTVGVLDRQPTKGSTRGR